MIGKRLSKAILEKEYQLIVFTRSPKKAKAIIPGADSYVYWDSTSAGGDEWKDYIKEADTVIHLAGENVMAKRWSDEHKKNVIESRRLGTKKLVDAIASSDKKPGLFLSASAIGYYGYDPQKTFNEDSPSGSDFFADVVRIWEEETLKVKSNNIREVRIRIGIVLDKNEGALAKMITPFKFFAGGPLGSGKQWFPWIHIDDLVKLFVFAVENENVNGVLNGVSPGIVNMNEFAKTLGKVMRRPALFKVPEFALRLIVGEGADAVTKVSKVAPIRTLDAGYKFQFENLETALKDILR